MGLKIIIQNNQTQAEWEVRDYFDAKAEQRRRHPDTSNMGLYGIAAHATRYPIICDDCGETYWANDPYAAHAKCKKGRERMGF